MNKKIIIILISIILAIAAIILIRFIQYKKQEVDEYNGNEIKISENMEISKGEVTDECLEEWDDYNKFMSERVDEASNNISESDTHYLLKDVLGYIEVYYLDEENKEYLYKKTTIPTRYLSQEDIEDLKIGIEVVGMEALNKILEDFE